MRQIFEKTSGLLIVAVCAVSLLAVSRLTVTAEQREGFVQLAAPSISNGSFESDAAGNGKTSLSGWSVTSGSVDVLNGSSATNGSAAAGSKFLDLANGTIQQTVTGFTPNQPYVLRIDYQGNTSDGALKDAKVIINGQELTQGLFGGDPPGIHSKEENDWVVCNGFEFIPSSSNVTLVIDSEESNSNGLFIDNIRFVEGTITQPPEHDWDDLTVDGGWRLLENGSFEQSVAPLSDPENTGPSNNPHLCGDAIPGWRVTRENTDRVGGGDWNVPDGSLVIDVGGHGPGGIAQTITDLEAGATYELAFEAARHRFWSGTLTTEIWANGQKVHEFSRTSSQTAATGYITEFVDMVADSNGKITFEIFSVDIDKGGNNVMDNFRMRFVSSGAATSTPTQTATPIPTNTPTLTPTSTNTPTPLPTSTPTATSTATLVPTVTPTPTGSNTPTPAALPTSTPFPPTETPDDPTGTDVEIYLPFINMLANGG